jgi:hypothetical protein
LRLCEQRQTQAPATVSADTPNPFCAAATVAAPGCADSRLLEGPLPHGRIGSRYAPEAGAFVGDAVKSREKRRRRQLRKARRVAKWRASPEFALAREEARREWAELVEDLREKAEAGRSL